MANISFHGKQIPSPPLTGQASPTKEDSPEEEGRLN
jgi:hypothetical protein